MNRPNLYRPIHKGLRSLLFETTALVARTDFADPAEADLAVGAVGLLLDLLDDHAEHEDRFTLPELNALAPPLAAQLEADHGRLEGLQAELRTLLPRARTGDLSATEAGELLGRGLNLLVAEHLRHMDREETQAMAVFWAHRTDPELFAVEGKIRASIPPEKMARFARILLPALSTPERVAMLAAARAALPAPAFAGLFALASEVLGPERMAAVTRRAGPGSV
jgi:hypothetical protein